MSDHALVCIVDVKAVEVGAFYLTAETCLNQVASLARFLSADLQIAMTYGHTDAKWKGRGLR